MLDYEAAKERMREIKEMVEREQRAAEARRAVGDRPTMRLAVGTRLVRLGLRLAGPAGVRAALGEAR
jgi:hypothetical protein